MNRFARLALAALFAAPAVLAQAGPILWYRQPARAWTEALPIGNGSMGAVVYGGVAKEQIRLQHETLWTGAPHNGARPGGSQYLGQIRQLLWGGRQKEAEELVAREFSAPAGDQSAAPLPLGDLEIDFSGIPEAAAGDYRREVNLDTAVASVQFTAGGVEYRREAFASYPANAIVIRLAAGRPGSLNFAVRLSGAVPGAAVTAASNGVVTMAGGVEGGAIRYETRVAVFTDGRVAVDGAGSGLTVSGAASATLILCAATNFVRYRDVSADPRQRNDATLAAARAKTYEALKSAHVADHQKLFRRVALDLGATPASRMPTDERIRAFAGGGDPGLAALLFQFGRYLLIASSRGGQPAGVEGLWKDDSAPSGERRDGAGIRAEMNYWPAEEANLPECELPLVEALHDLAESGAATAKEYYGAGGWVLHDGLDLWRVTAPAGASGLWPAGGAWLATHLWEHYLFTGDQAYLRGTAYPLIKGAALFFADTLVKDPGGVFLVTGPSAPPGREGLAMGPAIDRQIVRTLFGEAAAAARILGVDSDLRDRLATLRKHIAPDRTGKSGQLQPGMEDMDDSHQPDGDVAHLWGVYPGAEITPYGTPDLFRAAHEALAARGDAASGWPMAWRMNLWARFLDGNHAYALLKGLITPASESGAGLAPNLFEAARPFEMAGNLGVTAGIAEMLLQSQDPHGTATTATLVQSGEAAFVHLLPALPEAFPDGSVAGLVARGGVGVSILWKNGKLVKATLEPKLAEPIYVRYAGKEIEFEAEKGQRYAFGPDLRFLPVAPKPGPRRRAR